MGQFFKFLFASCLGTLLALGGIIFISIMAVSNIAQQAQSSEKVKPNTLLKINLSEAIPEKTNNVPVNAADINLSQKDIIGLQDLILMIEKAKDDDNIKGIYLEPGFPQNGLAAMSAIREALADFKESGKFIISYGTYYTQKAYYLASVSDEIYLNPLGSVGFTGFGVQVPFFKEMIDRLGVKAQVFYAGKFKSATEPFRRTEMSPENKLQVREYLDENFDYFLDGISQSRGIGKEELKRIADELLIREPKDAVTYKFVDGLKYKDEVLTEIRSKLGLDKDEDINVISPGNYFSAVGKSTNFKANEKIAVVFAEGNIIDGEGAPGSIGGEYYARMIRKIRQDDKVKAIVLRVNSGGGSVWASEDIWREMEMAREDGLHTVVSMGDVAASGGYYIACNSEKIFAEPNTITGSIGVFGILFNYKDFMDQKIGINFDTVKTSDHATIGSPFFDLDATEAQLIQESVDTIYQKFLQRVSNGRDMPVSKVDEIAQGRVWTGVQAKRLGLVDELGGLEDAIKSAAALAGLEDYRISEYPKTKDPFQQLIEELTGKSPTISESIIKEQLGEPLYKYYRYAKEIKEMDGVQARMPFILDIE